jgi:hypothetical protein
MSFDFDEKYLKKAIHTTYKLQAFLIVKLGDRSFMLRIFV